MNILLGYEPYRGFRIYCFSEDGKTDMWGYEMTMYKGWAKREKDGKCFNGSAYWKTIADCEDDMKGAIDAILHEEDCKATGRPICNPAPSVFFGFK